MADEQWGNKKVEVQVGGQKNSKVATYLWIGTIALLTIFATIFVLSRDAVVTKDVACCEQICGQLNQKCRGWNMDTLQCTYNYERFGYPGITEVFTFTINETYKAQVCAGNGTSPQPVLPQEPVNTTG